MFSLSLKKMPFFLWTVFEKCDLKLQPEGFGHSDSARVVEAGERDSRDRQGRHYLQGRAGQIQE